MKRTTELKISLERLTKLVSEKYGIELSEAHPDIITKQDPKADIRDDHPVNILKSITFKHVEEL